MKKSLLLILTIAATTMSSCNDKNAQNEEVVLRAKAETENAVLRAKVDSLQRMVEQLQTELEGYMFSPEKLCG